jgi:hypothetical protein
MIKEKAHAMPATLRRRSTSWREMIDALPDSGKTISKVGITSVRDASSVRKGKSTDNNPRRYAHEDAQEQHKQSRTHAAAEKAFA